MASFLAIGSLSTVLSAAIYAALVVAHWHYAVAVIAAFVLTVPIGYALNRQFTFQSQSSVSRSFPRVAAIYLTQQAFMVLAIGLLVDGLHLNKIAAYVVALPPAVAFSYLAMKRFGFR